MYHLRNTRRLVTNENLVGILMDCTVPLQYKVQILVVNANRAKGSHELSIQVIERQIP
jgi:hypothetical protein